MQPPSAHLRPDMKEEVTAAVQFFMDMMETPRISAVMPRLGHNLTVILSNKYKDHWFTDSPEKGQAYRCIEVCDSQGVADRVLLDAAAESGLKFSDLRLPSDLRVWVDPKEVACRFGDDLGSFLPIFCNEEGHKRTFIDRFDFGRLCERVPMVPIHMGRSCQAVVDRAYVNRMVRGVKKPLELELDRCNTVNTASIIVADTTTTVTAGVTSSVLVTPSATPPYSPTSSPTFFDSSAPSLPASSTPPSSVSSHKNFNASSGGTNSATISKYQQRIAQNKNTSSNTNGGSNRSPTQVSPTHQLGGGNHFTNTQHHHYHSTNNLNTTNGHHHQHHNSHGAGFSRSPPRINPFHHPTATKQHNSNNGTSSNNSKWNLYGNGHNANAIASILNNNNSSNMYHHNLMNNNSSNNNNNNSNHLLHHHHHHHPAQQYYHHHHQQQRNNHHQWITNNRSSLARV